jgi:tagatose 1,6-diphosphate aldolase
MTTTTTKPNPALKNYFVNLTPGKLMGLRQITDEKGRFKVFALDQSNSFKKALRALAEKLGKPAEPTYEQIRDAKIEMVKVLSPLSSAVLLDVNFGARQALNSLAFPKTVGLIVRSEASKDPGIPSEYEPGWSVEKIKKMGGSAVKLLIYMDVEDAAFTKAQLAFAEKLHKACQENDILLMTEELSFPRKGEDKKTPSYKARKIKNIVESTKLIGPLTDILKLEYPANMGDDSEQQQVENLARLNEAAIRPWVLLSAGEKFEIFAKQVELAMKAGCSGYMAGRAIFNEYFEQTTPEARHKFLQTTAMDRMKLLNKSVEAHSPSWMQRYGIAESEVAGAVAPTWYLGKGEQGAKGGATEGAY